MDQNIAAHWTVSVIHIKRSGDGERLWMRRSGLSILSARRQAEQPTDQPPFQLITAHKTSQAFIPFICSNSLFICPYILRLALTYLYWNDLRL